VWLFASGISQYNAALWTMRLELVGGILALVTAALIAGPWRPIRDPLVVGVLALVGLIMHPLCAVCAGTVLVTKFLRIWPILFSARIAVPLLAIGVGIGSTYYAFEDMLEGGPLAAQAERIQWLLHGLAALIVFLGVHGWRRLRDQPQPLGRWLGRLSFSTYVLHMPVIASVGAGTIVLLGYSALNVVVALAVSLAVIFLLSIPLSAFDAWWVRKLNRTAANIADRKRVQRTTAVATDAP
jgi:peptidoglycan/LPS O-acetylase OafA/YrhL